MLPWRADLAGRLEEGVVDSTLLRDNPLGDPHERPVWVYLPPGYDEQDQRYPSVYVIQGYTGHVAMWANRMPFRQPFLETADQVFADGSTPPCVVVFVDAWTSYGGSQFINSSSTGRPSSPGEKAAEQPRAVRRDASSALVKDGRVWKSSHHRQMSPS